MCDNQPGTIPVENLKLPRKYHTLDAEELGAIPISLDGKKMSETEDP